jgi:DNA-binding MarR family transcriptional regulator
VTLALTPSGEDLVARVLQWRRDELSRILGNLAPPDREAASRVLRLLVEAAGEGYGSVRHRLVPL